MANPPGTPVAREGSPFKRTNSDDCEAPAAAPGAACYFTIKAVTADKACLLAVIEPAAAVAPPASAPGTSSAVGCVPPHPAYPQHARQGSTGAPRRHRLATAAPQLPASQSQPAAAGAAVEQVPTVESASLADVSCGITLDLELSPEEAQWLVQPTALPTTATAVFTAAPPTTTAAAAGRKLSPRALLSRAAASLRSRLAGLSCLSRPAVAQ